MSMKRVLSFLMAMVMVMTIINLPETLSVFARAEAVADDTLLVTPTDLDDVEDDLPDESGPEGEDAAPGEDDPADEPADPSDEDAAADEDTPAQDDTGDADDSGETDEAASDEPEAGDADEATEPEAPETEEQTKVSYTSGQPGLRMSDEGRSVVACVG